AVGGALHQLALAQVGVLHFPGRVAEIEAVDGQRIDLAGEQQLWTLGFHRKGFGGGGHQVDAANAALEGKLCCGEGPDDINDNGDATRVGRRVMALANDDVHQNSRPTPQVALSKISSSSSL